MRRLLVSVFLLSRLALSGEVPIVTPKLENMQLAEPRKVGQLPDSIEESSGLVKSSKYKHKDIFWTHSDSGGKEAIYAVTSAGKLLREVPIPDSKNKDWEDISKDGQGRLIICDIGDNFHKRDQIVLYRLPEPDALDLNSKAEKPDVFRFTYPKEHGRQDAEALIVAGENAYLFTKDMNLTRCYKLPLPKEAPKEPVEAELFATTKELTLLTGAALSDDGKHLALVTYISIQVLDLPATETKPHPLLTVPRRSRLCWLGQTEAVAWDGDDLVLTTEGGAIYRVKDAAVRPKE